MSTIIDVYTRHIGKRGGADRHLSDFLGLSSTNEWSKMLVHDLCRAVANDDIKSQSQCCICLETSVMETFCPQCKNGFHRQCIVKCTHCPLCRYDMRTNKNERRV